MNLLSHSFEEIAYSYILRIEGDQREPTMTELCLAEELKNCHETLHKLKKDISSIEL